MISLIILNICSGCKNNEGLVIVNNKENMLNKLEQILDNDYKKEENKIKIDSLSRLICKKEYSNLFIERGFYYISIDELKKAEEDFNHILEVEPNDVYSNLGNALLFQLKRKYEESQKYVNKVFSLEPTNSLAFFIKAGNQKILDSVLSNINKSISISSSLKKNYDRRAMVYYSMDSLDKALEDINKLIKESPNNSSYYLTRILIYEKSSRLEDTKNDLTKLIEISPKSEFSCLLEREKIYEKMNDNYSAIKDIKRIIEITGESTSSYFFDISGLYAVIGKTDSCIIYAKKALEKGGKTKTDFENDPRFARVLKKKEFQEKIR